MTKLVTRFKKVKRKIIEWRIAKFRRIFEQLATEKDMLNLQVQLEASPLCVNNARLEINIVRIYVKLFICDKLLLIKIIKFIRWVWEFISYIVLEVIVLKISLFCSKVQEE